MEGNDRTTRIAARALRPGLGEQLRYLTERIDAGAEAAYRTQGLDYRPRYMPVMRALSSGAASVTDITAAVAITQGAVSQTVKLMEKDGLIHRRPEPDARRSALSLTPKGMELLDQLQDFWAGTFAAIEELEREIGFPLQEALARAIAALDKRDFADRLAAHGAGRARGAS